MQNEQGFAEARDYRDLVAVACGTKRGVFVGGHTCFKTVSKRVYYVRCECEECVGNAVWDVTAFEAHGGNAQRKKALESIRADLPGGGSVPLAKWLGDKGRVLGSSIVGERHWVWWPGEQLWYRCTVMSWMPELAVHEVLYDDGDVELLKWAAERTKPLPPGHDGDHSWGETEQEVALHLAAVPSQAADTSNLTPTAGAAEGLVGLAGGLPKQQHVPADSVAQRPAPSAQRGTAATGGRPGGSGRGEAAGPSQPPGGPLSDDVDLAFVLSKLPSEEHEGVRQLFSRCRSLQAQEAQWAAEVAAMQERHAQLRQLCQEARGHAAQLEEVQRQAQECQRGIEETQAALQASQQQASTVFNAAQQIKKDRRAIVKLRRQVEQEQPELARLRTAVERLREARAPVTASQVPAQFRQLLEGAAPHLPVGAPGGAAPGGGGPPGPAFSAMGAN